MKLGALNILLGTVTRDMKSVNKVSDYKHKQ